jgi:hypothetical protein
MNEWLPTIVFLLNKQYLKEKLIEMFGKHYTQETQAWFCNKQKPLQHIVVMIGFEQNIPTWLIIWKGCLTMVFGHTKWNMHFNGTTCFLIVWLNFLVQWVTRRLLDGQKRWMHIIIMWKILFETCSNDILIHLFNGWFSKIVTSLMWCLKKSC